MFKIIRNSGRRFHLSSKYCAVIQKTISLQCKTISNLWSLKSKDIFINLKKIWKTFSLEFERLST